MKRNNDPARPLFFTFLALFVSCCALLIILILREVSVIPGGSAGWFVWFVDLFGLAATVYWLIRLRSAKKGSSAAAGEEIS